MSSIKAGGSAFPVIGNPGEVHAFGITMRDYLAAKAMQSMIDDVARYNSYTLCAHNAYKMADAMLEARK